MYHSAIGSVGEKRGAWKVWGECEEESVGCGGGVEKCVWVWGEVWYTLPPSSPPHLPTCAHLSPHTFSLLSPTFSHPPPFLPTPLQTSSHFLTYFPHPHTWRVISARIGQPVFAAKFPEIEVLCIYSFQLPFNLMFFQYLYHLFSGFPFFEPSI